MSIVIMVELESYKKVCHTTQTPMKRTALYCLIAFLSLLGLIAVAPVFAESSHTSVDVETNTGGNTICQNGKCTTTTENNGTSHVCVNGKCYDSNSGKLDVQSDGAQVHINNNANSNTPTIEPTEIPLPTIRITNKVKVHISPSVTPHPTPDISRILEKHKLDRE